MGLHYTENFCIARERMSKVKRQPIEWEKVFSNHISDIISKIYNELIQLNSIKQNKTKKPQNKTTN